MPMALCGSQHISAAGIKYELTTTTVDGDEGIRYTTYGLIVSGTDGAKLVGIEDISTNRQWVEDFLDLCYQKDVSPVHIKDILEDFME